jgi:uncharacterized coiled-coil DUF342 family protein
VETSIGDVRQRAVALIQEAGTLLGMIPHLLDRTEELQSSADAATKDAENSRKEIAALRSEVQQLRADRDEMAENLSVIMNDVLRLSSEAVSKLRPSEKRSAFSRDGHAPAGDGVNHRSPSVTPWKREG